MSQIVIEGNYLNSRGGDLVAKLAEFLNGLAQLQLDVKVDGTQVVVSPKPEGVKASRKKGGNKKKIQKEKAGGKKDKDAPEEVESTLSKTKLKVYLKRFLNKQGLDNDLRVISGGKEEFAFRERQVINENLAPLEEKQ
jgi:hypothetical protein